MMCQTTHQKQGQEGRALANISPNMVRLCVGAKHLDDIVADLDQAIRKAKCHLISDLLNF